MQEFKDLNIPPLCQQILQARGITTADQAQQFLYPKLKNLKAPEQMKGLVEAARRVVRYIEEGWQIIVWGDYDVDGTTATGLLVNFFREVGVEVLFHIPDRLLEGYGLNDRWITENQQSFTSKKFLVITVDCGISNAAEVEKIKGIGGDVIVTDHHLIPAGGCPDCLVLNPAQQECGFHKEGLAGVGVAFYLAAAVRSELSRLPAYSARTQAINLKHYLGFVALGTVADLVEITPTNRILVRAGLEVLADTPFIGLNTLIRSCNLQDGEISTEDISFILAPKINAAGRLGKAEIVLRLFTSQNAAENKRAIAELEQLNNERKTLCETHFHQAIENTSTYSAVEQKCVICVGEYHLGVAGIVASRLVEHFKVPAIVLARVVEKDTTIVKGSARSIEGINIVDILGACKEVLLSYGGHAMAAGLSLSPENIDFFIDLFSKKVCAEILNNKEIQRTPERIAASVDMVMDRKTLDCLSLFEPYGPGNQKPVFADFSANIIKAHAVGRLKNHLQLIIRGQFSNYKGIGFHLGDRLSEVQEVCQRTLHFTPTKNRYRGTTSWQLRVVDL